VTTTQSAEGASALILIRFGKEAEGLPERKSGDAYGISLAQKKQVCRRPKVRELMQKFKRMSEEDR
jgi:formylmethanofuran dehydrogenase subunit E